MMLAALLIGILSTSPQPVLDCQLAKDIAEAALTRTIYLGGSCGEGNLIRRDSRSGAASRTDGCMATHFLHNFGTKPAWVS